MRRALRAAVALALALALSTATSAPRARANPEPSVYDARAVGLGGSGIAYLDGPTAMVHDPALLERIDTFEATLVGTLLFAELVAPFAGEGSELHSDTIIAPLLFAGGAGRVHERVTVGLGAYITTGFGGGFSDVAQVGDHTLDPPRDQTVTMVVGELGVPVAVRVTDTLRLGATLRLPYARQDVALDQETFPGLYQRVRQELSGWGIPGVLLGVHYRPLPELSLAAAYRSKVRIDMDGHTDLFIGRRPSRYPTETTWYVPHMLRLGAAAHLLEERLLLTAEFRVQMHGEANRAQAFRVEGFDDLRAPFDWNTVYGVVAGIEGWVTRALALRAGYSSSNSATPKHTATQFTPPPSYLHAVYAGVGVEAGPISADLAVNWGFGDARIAPDEAGTCAPGERIKVGCPGRYEIDTVYLAFSLTYHR